MDTGRWTIIRHEPSARRRPSEPHVRHRVLARCICGLDKVVWLDDIAQGRSNGCDSHRCRARWEVAGEWEAQWRQELHEKLRAWMRDKGRADRLAMRQDLAQSE